MRKLDLRNYMVAGRAPDGTKTSVPFDVQEALVELCFVPAAGCKPLEVLKRQKIAEKIAAAKSTVLLEEAEWDRIKGGLEAVTGLGRPEVELVHRILDAPELKPGKA